MDIYWWKIIMFILGLLVSIIYIIILFFIPSEFNISDIKCDIISKEISDDNTHVLVEVKSNNLTRVYKHPFNNEKEKQKIMNDNTCYDYKGIILLSYQLQSANILNIVAIITTILLGIVTVVTIIKIKRNGSTERNEINQTF